MRFVSALLASSFLVFAGCSGGSGTFGDLPGNDPGADGGKSDKPAADDGTESPGGPEFLALATSTSSIDPGESFTVSAVMTDEDGLDDLAGGTLVDEFGSTYGAFGTGTQKGGYQLTITWALVNQAKPIAFAMGTKGTRKLEAQFFDAAGHKSTKSLSIELTCNDGLAACGGTCLDTSTDVQNCGTCGTTCPELDTLGGLGRKCEAGKCASLTACTWKADDPYTCNGQCAKIGKSCSTVCGAGGYRYHDQTCGQLSATFECNAALTVNEYRCCCL